LLTRDDGGSLGAHTHTLFKNPNDDETNDGQRCCF
jgi:hypothetical protein